MTNADKIRSMTDEELAKWIESPGFFSCNMCVHLIGSAECKEENCAKAALKWIKQEAEEEK